MYVVVGLCIGLVVAVWRHRYATRRRSLTQEEWDFLQEYRRGVRSGVGEENEL